MERFKEVDQEIIDQEIYQRETVDKKKSAKRRDIAKRRLKLGFNDKGAEEMDDAQIEYIEHSKYLAETKVQESQNRGNIKVPT